jgi:hypothetical protein
MKFPILPLALAVALFAASSLSGAEPSPFANFEGRYFKGGSVRVTDGTGSIAKGRVRPVFRIGPSGQNARLKITGSITSGGATIPFSAAYVFKRRGSDGIYGAAFSNLAPGLDNGHSTDLATYVAGPRSIRAEAHFVSGTTSGTATLFVRLKKRPRGTQILVTQTLATDALMGPITWTFKGLSRR